MARDPEVVRDIDSLGAEAVSALRKFLAMGDVTGADINRARVAASAFSAVTRVRQTEGAREATFLMLARELANNKDEFREYVKIGMPTAPILKALPAKK